MLLEKIFDDDRKILNYANEKVAIIKHLDSKYREMSDLELKEMTNIFKKELNCGKKLDDILCDAYAVVKETIRRIKKKTLYDVQLLGGVVIHNGDIAEMKTGEGKTLTAILPVYLNALEGKGVHVITVNEYLAKRDAELNGEIYRFLGLSVGVNKQGLNIFEKQQVYGCDITYTTSVELVFDYLRDNMATKKTNKVLKELHYALIDEVDSVLIDEARTPLIISGNNKGNESLYLTADKFVKSLNDSDIEKDEDNNVVTLSENGIIKGEKYFNVNNLYNFDNKRLIHSINQALKANFLIKKDVDYVVYDGEIKLVDKYTGRIMEGRQYSDGLHQAIEMKEELKVRNESTTLASITYQNFFRLYDKLSGMSGTVKCNEEEMLKTYNMRVVSIPTNKPVIRKDLSDYLYITKEDKYKALVNDVLKIHKSGQPILIGTADILDSEIMSAKLKEKNIKHSLLNAKNHEEEAKIIARAGEKWAVTIATNMAGRGTDIKIDEDVKKLGGLVVLGSEHHESLRVDNQLRGRAGRQGDPGLTRFYVSMEDELIKKYVNDKIKNKISKIKKQPIVDERILKYIYIAQQQAEGNNFDERKIMSEYDDIINKQRDIIYKQRNSILEKDNVHSFIEEMFKKTISNHSYMENIDLLNRMNLNQSDISFETREELSNILWNSYNSKVSVLNADLDLIEKQIVVRVIDKMWAKHIVLMDKLKNMIGLRAYGQIKPLEAYVEDGYNLFEKMLIDIAVEITTICLRMNVVEH